MKAKAIALILSVLFSFSIFGCGNNTQAPSPQQSPSQTQAVNSTPVQTQQVTPAPVEKPKVQEHRITGTGPNGEGIKGHIDKKGVKIYHLPDDRYYNRTTHVAQWFFTERDAQNAGYRAIIR
ncbi:hypothetical protein Ga0466249_004797 [Sporomusaceae bacterium BoRhaA]|uniref:sunset domain-containing protein n=1 Tax=Pelorhabdus rhamnosifermentans TaxID=2772457 RepID=UPI001C062859|nr:hypothetical protein [Pelorhabdus rhamnosifermentans]MBU2703649.1 hypothetical protein [Pelorhabdus rhamnosifermentans]